MNTSERTSMAQDVSKQLAIASRLVQNYRLATPFMPGKKIRYYMATAFNANREAVLFSIGSNGAVNYIYPDDGSDTGWSCTDLSFPGKANYITAANISDGSIVVFASGTDNQIYGLNGNLLERKWIPVPGNLPYASTGLDTCFDGNGNPYLVSFRGYAPYFQITPYTENDWHSAGEGGNNDSIFDWCPAYFPASFDNKNFSNSIGYYACRTTIHSIGDRGILGIALYNAYSPSLLDAFTKVTVARNNKGYDEPFVVFDEDQGLYYLYVQNANSNTFAMQKISGDIAVEAILGGNAYNNMMEVYVLSTAGHLFHTRQNSTADSGWSDIIPLNNDYQFTDFIGGHNPDGYTDVFALTTGGDLTHIWQDPNSLEWHFEEVELGSGPLEEYSGYNIRLTVYDNNQVAAAQTGVHIYAESPISVQINGKMVWLDKKSYWQGTTNESGIVELAVKTESLGIPVLRAWADFMPPNDRVLINAGGSIQQRLSTLDDAGNDLLKAQITQDDGSSQQLVQGIENRKQEVVENISKSVKAAMMVLLPPDLPKNSSVYLHETCNLYVTSYVTGDQDDPESAGALYKIAEQYWNVCFSNNTPVYNVFTAEEAAAWYEKRQLLENIARSGSFHFDWGDLISSIKNGIARLVEVTVSATVNGVKLALQIVINGVNYLFDTVVKHLNQLFDVVEEIFDKIQVTFDRIYRWLGLILNWEHITNTQEVIAYGINQLFEVQKAALQKVEAGINQFFTDARSLANSSFAQLINNTQMKPSILTNQQTLPAAPVSTDDGNHNIVYSALMNNIGNGKMKNNSELHKTEVRQVIDDIILLLTREAEGFAQNPAFNQAVTYFTEASRQPDKLLQNTMAGILSILQGISDCTLQILNRIASSIVEALIALVNCLQQLLTSTWDVPLLSQLFTNFCNGQELNFINLIALLIAVPVTTTYKLKFREAPYPDKQSVDIFKTLFSSHAILVAAGIITGDAAKTIGTLNLSEEEAADALQVASIVLGVSGFYGSLIGTGLNTFLDAIPPDSDKITPAFTKFLSTLTYTLTVLLQLSTIPWPFTKVGLPVNGFDKWTSIEFENFIWVLHWMGIGVDGIFLWQYGKLAGQSEDPGVCISTMFGLINLTSFVVLAIWERDKDQMKTAQNIIGAVPGSVKILRLKPVVKLYPPGASLVVLAAVDVVCGYIAASLSLVRTFAPNNILPAGENQQPVMVYS